jgi:RNA recognition motif-containing protein
MNNKRLFVGGIAYATSEEALQEAFAKAGTVVSARIIKERETGRSKGFGFVEMETEEMAEAAIDMWNGKDLDGRELIVNIARAEEKREDRGPRREWR